jgi:hypothetical protein
MIAQPRRRVVLLTIEKDPAMIRLGVLTLVVLAAVVTKPVNGQTHYRQPPSDVVAILNRSLSSGFSVLSPAPSRHVESQKTPATSR